MATYRAHLPKGFETLKTALKRGVRLVSLLNAGSAPERSLVQKLEDCSPESPCGSGACPICTREFRLWLLKEGLQVVEAGGPTVLSSEAGHTRYWTSASVIPADCRCPPGELHTFDLATKVKSLATAIGRSPLASGLVIGGFDISFNASHE
jgi:hypothetical protein